MPAEWEPHAGTWLAWPHKEASWPGKLSLIPPIWVEIVRALAPGETVHILVNDAAPEPQVRELLQEAQVPPGRIHFHQIPTNDAWLRDSGPIFVTRQRHRRREFAIVNWTFNTWGGKYPPWDDDDRVPERIAALLKLPVFTPGLVLEGGSIDVNGRGTLLTTEACLLHPNRNPQLQRHDIERYLRDYLGVRHILWLRDGIVGDDTDGHIDDLARFVAQSTVVTVVEDDPADENYERLQANYRLLQEMTDQDGRPLQIVTLPMPGPVVYADTRLPASYANFYIGNRVVLVPTFDDPADAAALTTIQELFPTRRIIGIHSTDLIWGLGAFHCVTQQQPATSESERND